mmetsp:Transcript_22377/g.52826  ORF Transcript_22377/g.52826 Transcript_22377/m.52826 type:complete len:129 (+) Transcript_22377:54-440(+)
MVHINTWLVYIDESFQKLQNGSQWIRFQKLRFDESQHSYKKAAVEQHLHVFRIHIPPAHLLGFVAPLGVLVRLVDGQRSTICGNVQMKPQIPAAASVAIAVVIAIAPGLPQRGGSKTTPVNGARWHYQ